MGFIKGTVEIAQINGDKVILCVSQDDPVIAPLFDNMKSYLPEKFTLEFDFWVGPFTKREMMSRKIAISYVLQTRIGKSCSNYQS